MDGNLLELLKDLRIAKNAGELDDDESLANQETRWRNRLDYRALETCLKHHDEEIRIVALAVIVESKKSTLTFTKIELDFVIMFLNYNLGERVEYVPLIKKALKRIKESLAVLQRHIARQEKMLNCENHVDTHHDLYEHLKAECAEASEKSLILIDIYRKFFKTFREICIKNIRPGSTNSRKRSSLQMLQLGQEFLEPEFKDLPWTKDQADKLFECLLLDTYEVNKEIIYKIASCIDPYLLSLDDANKVREIIDVALELANCIRPIDSITASYMLKLCLLSPVIQDVLEIYKIPQSPPLDSTEYATLRLIMIVVESLKDPVKLAEENIVTATGKYSLYGYLFCIRNLIAICDLGKIIKHNHEAWTQTIAEIIKISFRLNRAVSQIVNNSSPEGHLPMDIESSTLSSTVPESSATTVTPQMVLVCSWRTVKEVSLLFGYLSAKSPITNDKSELGLLAEEQLIEIGEHLVTLLFETKHRGAFEQAHVGFGQLCTRLWRLSHETLNKLPKVWLHHLLLAVSGLSPGNAKLCATRRSAGVPFMVQALVSSDPFIQSKPAEAVFHSVMKLLLGFTNLKEDTEITAKTRALMYQGTIFYDLQDTENTKTESSDGISNRNHRETMTEVKTHSLNILRALFKHAQLGDLAMTYAADGLSAAITSYDGKTWAERNAATLLFSSLITRIFGVQRTKDHVNLTLHNKMTGRIFFERHPSLLPFMLNELQLFVDSSDTLIKPSVQSILLLLSRLYPCFNFDDTDCKWKIDEFIKLVSACAKSRVYKTRELAARALVPLLTGKRVCTFIVELFDKILLDRDNDISFNALHGYMLQIVEILKSPQFQISELSPSHINTFLVRSRWIVENLESTNDRSACFSLATAYVMACRKFVQNGIDINEFDKVLDRIIPHLNNNRILKRRPGFEIYELAVTKLFVAAIVHQSEMKIERNHKWSMIAWHSILSHNNPQVQIVGWSRIVGILEQFYNAELIDIALFIALDNITRKIVDPELQDGVYDFLYRILMKFGKDDSSFGQDSFSISSGCKKIVNALVLRSQVGSVQESPSFLRLLGKAYGTLSQCHKDEFFTLECKRSIYKTFLNNTWMGTADTGCRIAISSVMYGLFVNPADTSVDNHLLLDWWTSLLNLLVDDHYEVRRLASLVVSKIKPTTELQCISTTTSEFFEKFIFSMTRKRSVAFAALFAWSITLSGDADYEMDQSDVFNKCYNYEIYEPLWISDLCNHYLDTVLDDCSIDEKFPVDVKQWLDSRLNNIDLINFTNPRELITQYRKTVPVITGKLDDIIDPTYNDKFLQILAFDKFASLIVNPNVR